MPYSDEEKHKYESTLEDHFPEIANLSGRPYHSHYYKIRKEPPSGTVPVLDPLRDVLRRKLPYFLSYSKEEKLSRNTAYIRREPPEGISPFIDRIARFIIAFAVGASLVVPMVVMLFHPSQTKSVVTVSVSVILFSACLSLGMKPSNTETVAATAAYAAVLVVFVGASGSSH
jgi:hypothetical protein